MARLLNKNTGLATFHANQTQKDKAVNLVIKDLENPSCRIIIPENDSARDIAIDAVNEATEAPLVLMSGDRALDIYHRALQVISSWTADSIDRIDESREAENISKFEAVRESLIDCIHVPLLGSPKQIKWAEALRLEKLETIAVDILENRITLEAGANLLSNNSAKWWIDNRA